MGPQQQVPMWTNPYMLNPFGQVMQPQSPMINTQMMAPSQTQMQTIQQPQATFVQGRVVESESDIRPNEIPMDGSVTLFPKSDYTVIFGKTWTKDGTIKPMRFILEQDAPPKPAEEQEQKPALDAESITQIVNQVVQEQFQSFANLYIKPLDDAIAKLNKNPSNLIV